MDSKKSIFVHGNNFSGRTNILMKPESLIGLSEIPSDQKEYISPEIYNSYSGVCASVNDEMLLYGIDVEILLSILPMKLNKLIRGCLFKNPSLLSGGQQAIVSIIIAICLNYRYISLDNCLEQIDDDLIQEIFSFIENHNPSVKKVIISHNGNLPIDIPITKVEASNYLDVNLQPNIVKFENINPNIFDISDNVERSLFRLDNISFGYSKNVDLFNDLNLNLETGKIYSFIGSNGIGKSTLAKLLSGVLRPNNGTYTLNDKKYKPYDVPGEIFSYHFQNPDVQLFNNTVEKELSFGLKNLSLINRRHIETVARTFGLSKILKEHPLDMPFVIRKRIALASSMCKISPFYIFDEPNLLQDETNTIALVEIFKKLIAKGYGVILISHSKIFLEKNNCLAFNLNSNNK